MGFIIIIVLAVAVSLSPADKPNADGVVILRPVSNKICVGTARNLAKEYTCLVQTIYPPIE